MTAATDETTKKLGGLREKFSKSARSGKGKRARSRSPKGGKRGKKLKMPKFGAIFTPGSTACFILAALLFSLIGWLLFQGAHIYADLGRKVGESQVIDWKRLGAGVVEGWKYGHFVRDLIAGSLDLVANLLHSLTVTSYGLGFLIIFLLIQAGEVAPTVIKHSPKIRKSMIASLRKFDQIEPQAGDSAMIVDMIDDYNRYYESFIFGLRIVQFVCFCVDGAVVLYAAPPLKGGWSVWATGIDWTNVMRGSITLFFLWLAVWCFCLVRKGIRIFKGAV